MNITKKGTIVLFGNKGTFSVYYFVNYLREAFKKAKSIDIITV
ncbi:hypothetical protein [Clostridium puniceum]|nr:hypothetical protein [Clostridium puniceum]